MHQMEALRKKIIVEHGTTKYGASMQAKLSRKSTELTSTQIERFYRKKIIAGGIAAGTKLPSNQVLSRQWSSSTSAVQKALASLAAEGLIERRQRRGTFVRDSAQQTCIGILYGPDLIYSASTFYRLLGAAIQAKLNSLYLQTRVYNNLTFFSRNSADYSQGNFETDRKNYPFKGYILIGTFNVPKTLISDDIKPRAVFQDTTRGEDVILDYPSFVKDSLVQLKKKGFKRITYFRGVQKSPLDLGIFEVEGLIETARSLSLPKPITWSVPISGHSATYEREIDNGVNQFYENLGSGTMKRQLPDVFLVQDDIAARPLIVNLLRRGIRIPEDVSICVQSTSDNPVYYGVPVYHYEFPVAEVAQKLSDILAARLKNLEPDALPHWVPGRFLEPT